MKLEKKPPALDANEEIPALIETLLATGQRLEELTGGEVDTVSGRDGRTFLLRRAQEQLRYSEAARQSAILSALPAHIALLDRQGLIISVNEAWRRYAQANVFHAPGQGMGINYLDVCDRAQGNYASEAHQVAAGIRAVLGGAKKSFSIEYPCHSPSEQRWFLLAVTPLAEDHLNGAVVMHLNITERRQAEAAAIRLAAIVESSGDAIIGKNLASIITSWNQGAELLFGYTADEMVGTSILRLLPADRTDDHQHILARVKRGENVAPFETVRQTKAGTLVNISVTASPIKDATSKVIGMSIVARDITERVRVESALLASQANMAAAQRLAHFGSWELELADSKAVDADALRWSDEMFRIAGYEPGAVEVNRDLFFRLVHSEDREPIRQAVAVATRERREYSIVHRLIRPDGETRVVQEIGQIVCDEKTGQPVKIVGTAHDITERKRVETALRASEAEFRVLAEAMPQIIWVTRPDGWHTHFNQRWIDYTGLTLEESLGHGWLPPFHPEDQPLAAARWKHANDTGKPYEIEYRLRGADGRYRWMLGRAMPLRDAAGVIVKWFGTCTDIQDLKEAEREISRTNRELRESEARFSGAFEHAPIGMALVAPEGRWLKVNRALCDLVGYSEAELLARTFQDITHPEDLAADLENVRRLLAGEIPTYEMEKRYIHARGHLITILLKVSLIRDGEGRPLSFISQIQDITERKRNETRFRRLVDSNAQGVFFWNTKGEITGGNDAFLNIVGFTRADLEAGRLDWVAMTPPEYAHLDRHALDELARTGVCPSYEKAWIRKDGSLVPILMGAAMFEDKPDDGVCFVLDITERKLSEAALKQAHQELVKASRQAGMAEVATGILHNVGNVLNSVNIASSCVADSIRKSKAASLDKVVELLREHEADLGDFLTVNPQGKQIPGYLAQLAAYLAGEQTAALKELAHLQKNIEHIKDIISMQQGFAKFSSTLELLSVTDLVDDALKMNASTLARHDIVVRREFQEVPLVTVEKHQVLQILVNLVRNAMQACDEAKALAKQITLRVTRGNEVVRIAVTDNGIGIPAENLTRLFAHGFTTKQSGHGFGLHSAALAAKKMGGSLTVHSAGPGHGATFTLELPAATPARENL